MTGRRRSRGLGVLLLVLVLIAIAPAFYVETVCRADAPAQQTASGSRFGITDADYPMALTNSVLSYPEWRIVYAYQDLAAVLHDGDEYRFDYLPSIVSYWSDLCVVNRLASSQGPSDIAEKAMLYIIGWSFTAELAIKGTYETTAGRVFAWLRGPVKGNEDRFAAAMADDYARFLEQTPWYDYSFWTQVRRLWGEVPFDTASPLRAIERRAALTAEWTIKAGYAKAIAALADLSPAEPKIESVVAASDANPGDVKVHVIRDLADGKQLIVTPRYAAFTQIVGEFAKQGRQICEIAGNDSIFVTVLAPDGIDLTMPGADPVLYDAVQSRPGWRRVGLEMKVPDLVPSIREIEARGAVLEHLYDY